MEDRPCRVLLAGPDPPPPALGPCRAVWSPAVTAEPVPGSALLALRAAEAMPEGSALALTSPRAPRLLAAEASRAGTLGRLRAAVSRLEAWAVGPATAEAARKWLGVDARLPQRYTVAFLAAEIAARGPPAVLAYRQPLASRTLALGLAAKGVPLADVVVYRVSRVKGWRPPPADVAAATSGMVAEAIVASGWRGPVAAIGPETAARLRQLGVEPVCVAEEHTLEGLARCLEKIVGGGRG